MMFFSRDNELVAEVVHEKTKELQQLTIELVPCSWWIDDETFINKSTL